MQMCCDRLLQSCGGEIIWSEHKKKVSFLSLSNFPNAVQEKKSLQDTETREEPANGQSGGKTLRDTLIRGEPKYSNAKACEGFK